MHLSAGRRSTGELMARQLLPLSLLLALLVVCAPLVSALSLTQYLLTRFGAAPYTSAELAGPGGVVEMVQGVGPCLRLSGLGLDSVSSLEWSLLAPVADTHNIAMIDLSNNTLLLLDFTLCGWCGGEDIQRIDLQDNRLPGSVMGLIPLLPGLLPLIPADISDTLRYLDLSRNPISSLPLNFENSAATSWFRSPHPDPPTFKCSGCRLTGLASGLQRTWAVLDLSHNDFSRDANMKWITSLGHSNFIVTQLLDLSHCQLKTLPADAIHGGSDMPAASGPRFPTAASVIDLSHNDFSAVGAVSLVGLAFEGVVRLSHCGMTAMRGTQLAPSKIGGLDLSYNNFGAIFDLQGLSFSNTPREGPEAEAEAVAAGAGTLDASHSGISFLATSALAGLQVSTLILSGNSFSEGSGPGGARSWAEKCFDGARVSTLLLDRCAMSASTLASHSPPAGGGGRSMSVFHGLQGLQQLSMSNDAGDTSADRASWNRFDPLPNQWLLESESLHSTLESLHVGEVYSAPAGFWGNVSFTAATVASQGLAVTVQLPEGTTGPLSQGSVAWNLMTGYSSYSLEDRLTYTLELRGHGFVSEPAPPSLAEAPHPEGDRLVPSSLTLPLDPAFLQRGLLDHFPSIARLEYAAPSSYFADPALATPWSPLLSDDSVPADLLASAEGLVEFAIRLPLASSPPSPVSTLPESFFSWLAPSTGFGALVSIDLSTAQLTSYPRFLFAGLSRGGTVVAVDMQLLYAGLRPIPTGFFDDVPAVSVGAKALTGTSKLNKARACPFIGQSVEHYPASVAQQCNLCPSGSYSSSVSGFYFCARCPPGHFCTNSASKPCPAGTYQPEREQSSCVNCDAGTYNEAQGQAQAFACISCAAGKHNAHNGSATRNACVECDDGSISALPGAFQCTSCQPGTYSDAKHLSCLSCPVGRYSEHEGASSLSNCTRCAGGSTTTSAGSISPGQCVDISCRVGQWFDSSRTSQPDWSLDPVTGEPVWVERPAQYYCNDCEPGYSCSANQKSACVPGFWAGPSQAECSPCPRGTYMPSLRAESADQCIPCPPGTFGLDEGRASCTSCPAGTRNQKTGSYDNNDCIPCATAAEGEESGAGGASGRTNATLCTSGAATPIELDSLLPAASLFLDASASGLSSSRASYNPVRGGPSLRLSAVPDDASLILAGASDVPLGSSSSSHSNYDPTGDLIISDTMFVLLLSLLIGSVVPLLLYRAIPQRLVPKADLMSQAHNLEPGGVSVNRPTQWGAAFSMCFLLVAIYVAIELGTASNASLVNTLQPSSANNNTGTAQGAFQFSLKAYGSPAAGSGLPHALDSWCTEEGAAPMTGFTGNATLRSVIQGSACVLLVDCLDCGIGGVGSVTLSLPYVAQLLEWEVWVTSAVPGSWSRFYGVVSQLPGQMLDAASTLRFSLIESYFLDERRARSITYCTDARSRTHLSASTVVTCSLPDASSGSGFELAFSEYESVAPQVPTELTADSKVQLTFLFSKQDLIYQTTVSAKLSVFQVLSSVLATVVSLLSVFCAVFAFSEQHLLRRLKLSAGPYDAKVHIVSEEERAVEEAARRKQKQKSAAVAALSSVQVDGSAPDHKLVAADALDAGTAEASAMDGTSSAVGGAAGAGIGAGSAVDSLSPVNRSRHLNQHGGGAFLRLDPDVQDLLQSHNSGLLQRQQQTDSGAAAAASAALTQEVAELRAAQQAERAQTAALLAQMQTQLAALQSQRPLSQQPDGEQLASPSAAHSGAFAFASPLASPYPPPLSPLPAAGAGASPASPAASAGAGSIPPPGVNGADGGLYRRASVRGGSGSSSGSGVELVGRPAPLVSAANEAAQSS